MEIGQVGVLKRLQFALYEADGFTRLTGVEPEDLEVELWRDEAGERVQVVPSGVVVAELTVGSGEYAAAFTPEVGGDHQVVVRHAGSSADWSASVRVGPATSADSRLTDILLLLGGGVTGLPS